MNTTCYIFFLILRKKSATAIRDMRYVKSALVCLKTLSSLGSFLFGGDHLSRTTFHTRTSMDLIWDPRAYIKRGLVVFIVKKNIYNQNLLYQL